MSGCEIDPAGPKADRRSVRPRLVGESRAPWRLVLGGVVLLLVPLVVALAVLHEPRWYPVLELAQTELHVRDVGTRDTPLTGLIGRVGGPSQRGSHPGPLSFFALAPGYRLFGATPWALQVATASVHLAAAAAILWIALRRGGTTGLLVALAIVMALARFYGAAFLTEPWNPYLPVLCWVVFVLSTWSVAERDVALLPVAVVAGSFCAQTHISYAGLVGGLGALALAAALNHIHRLGRGGPERTRAWRWILLSFSLGALLWAPPMLDEVLRRPGNLRVLLDYFGDPAEEAVGLRRGGELVLQHLDPWRLLFGGSHDKVVLEAEPNLTPGVALLVLWLISVVAAWRVRSGSLLRLHGVLCVTLGIGVISASRVYGLAWAWLFQWVWGLTALIVIAVALTWDAVRCRAESGAGSDRAVRSHVIRITCSTLAVILAFGSSAVLAQDAATVSVDDVRGSRALRDLAPSTVRSIERDSAPGADPDARYLLLTTDPIGVVGTAQAFGLLNELDRAGIVVGVGRAERLRAAPHLTIDPAQATSAIQLVTGPAVEEWDRKPGARRVASHDPRSREERALQERLRRDLDAELRSRGLDDLLPAVQNNLVGAIFSFEADPRVPRSAITKLEMILELGQPSGVFLHS